MIGVFLSKKKERMIQKAKKELAKNASEEENEFKKEENPPSAFSGFFLILAGVVGSMYFLSNGNTLMALAVGTPFLIIGISRTIKATSSQFKNKSTV